MRHYFWLLVQVVIVNLGSLLKAGSGRVGSLVLFGLVGLGLGWVVPCWSYATVASCILSAHVGKENGIGCYLKEFTFIETLSYSVDVCFWGLCLARACCLLLRRRSLLLYCCTRVSHDIQDRSHVFV